MALGDELRRVEFEKVVKQDYAKLKTPTLMGNAYPSFPFKSRAPLQSDVYLQDISSSKLSQWHPFHSGQYIFCKAHLENLILSNLGDRGEMAHSIEGRTPFLDHYLTEYTDNLPPSMKIRWENGFIEKYVLREAARPFVTDEIYKKRKHPYSAPLKYNLGGPLHQLMKRLVNEEAVEELGFLKAGHWDERVDGAFKGDEALFKLVISVAQWVILGKRFTVKRAIITDN